MGDMILIRRTILRGLKLAIIGYCAVVLGLATVRMTSAVRTGAAFVQSIAATPLASGSPWTNKLHFCLYPLIPYGEVELRFRGDDKFKKLSLRNTPM